MHNCTEMYEESDIQNLENLKEQAERRRSRYKDENLCKDGDSWQALDSGLYGTV